MLVKPYLTRVHNLSDAVCNVDYLCHRGCSMSLTLHESCSITLALRSLGFPGRRGIHFVPPPRPCRPALRGRRSRRQRASFPAELPVEQKGFSLLFSQTNTRHHQGVSSWLPVTVQLATRERAGQKDGRKAASLQSRWSRDE